MKNYELFLQKDLADYALRHGLAKLLQVAEVDVEVVDNINELGEFEFPVVIHRERLDGEFAQFISVYITKGRKTLSESVFAAQVSSSLGCSVLFAKDDPNPYLWTLLSEDGTQKHVLLQDEPLDVRGEAIVKTTLSW